MKTIFLHIGQPRSGSTFLQTKYYKKLKLNFVGKPYSTKEKKKENHYFLIERKIFYLDDKTFNNELNNIVNDYKKIFVKTKNLLSIENIFAETKTQKFIFERTIKRFVKIFSKIGKLKVIYILRSPRTFIISYLRYNIVDIIKSKKIYNFKKKKFIKKDILEIFNFTKKVIFLNETFNKKNIKYLFFEELNSNLIPELNKFLNENVLLKNKQKKKVNSMSIFLSLKLIAKNIKLLDYNVSLVEIFKISYFFYLLYFQYKNVISEINSILYRKNKIINNSKKFNEKLIKHNYL